MEIFENKISDKVNLEINRQNVSEAFQLVFDKIMDSVAIIPWEIKCIQYYLIEAVKAQFPNTSRLYSAGSIFFLRFLCPSLVIPDKLNIVPVTPTPNVQRGLLFITKILQTLASDLVFGVKEVQMIWFNPLIEKNKPRFQNFLSQISEKEEYIKKEKKIVQDGNFQKLKSEIITILDKLEPILISSDV